jgi:hypothetical protein
MAADRRLEELPCRILEENVPGGRRAPAHDEDVAASRGAGGPPRTRAATNSPAQPASLPCMLQFLVEL